MDDTIYRRDAIETVSKALKGTFVEYQEIAEKMINKIPSAQPFHNITMNDVLKYIDGMPEDVWQEFTACLECRGWELQIRTAKWCGSEFA